MSCCWGTVGEKILGRHSTVIGNGLAAKPPSIQSIPGSTDGEDG